MKTNVSSTSRHKGIKITLALFHHQRKRVLLTAGLVVLIFSSLVLLSLLFQPRSHSAYAAVGEYSLWFPGVRPEPDLDLSGYLEVPYAPELNPSGGEITIEAWVKRNDGDRNETVVGNGYINSYWLGFSSSGKLNFHPHGYSSGVDSNGTVPAGFWTHIAATYDGTTRRYYINGILDMISTEYPGDITPSSGNGFLGIGFDREEPAGIFFPNYFYGNIDNVRIWNIVRTAAQIKDGMFQSINSPMPGLLAEWDLNGNAYDPVGGHDGILRGQVIFSNEGAIPHDIRIPQVSVTPILDGHCNIVSEYTGATQVTVDGTSAWLMHTDDDMWVCFDDLREENLWAQVFLDVDYTRLDPAQPEHLLLEVKDDGTLQAREGLGTGTYTNTLQADGQWDGFYRECCGEFPTYRAEFRISSELLKGWEHVIGLALGKNTGLRGGSRLWPALAYASLPSTWSSSTLGGIGEPRTFSGEVVYQPRDIGASPVGIAGVKVNLIGYDSPGGEAMVATTNSNLDGSFSLYSNDDYTNHRIEIGPPPKGYLNKYAVAGPSGTAVDPRTIDFGTAGPGTYTDNRFILKDALPYVIDSLHGPKFLIIATQEIIDSGALDEFVNFKRWLGFTVEVISVEEIDDTFEGLNRLERIRNLEKTRFNTQGNHFHQYLMLVGDRSVIPFAQFTLWFNGYKSGESTVIDLDACKTDLPQDIDYELSDWYYADLVSNFDSNGNGCLLDGVRIGKDKVIPAPGYTPDTWPNFQATVAVGRIPFNTENAVRSVLANSMHFEQQSEWFKNQTLFAASHYWLEGQYWVPQNWPDGIHKPCPVPEGEVVEFNSHTCAKETEDAANYVEAMKASFLNIKNYYTTIFYESVKAPGSSPVLSPLPLTAQNVLDALGTNYYGVVNLWGHGGHQGVYQTRYTDVNANGLVDSPTEPIPFNTNEIAGGTILDTNGLATLAPDNSHGSVYIAAACSTGSPLADSFGSTLVEQGHGVGWIGALNVTRVIAPIDIDTTTQLLKYNLRLGDALWYTLSRHATNEDCCSARWSTGLYGDPTLSYWGNPGGHTTLAAWPMSRYNPRGQGYTPLAGPEVPKEIWDYNTNPVGTITQIPSPVVSKNGEVIVAHGWYVDVLRQGSLYQRLELDGPAYGTPAISADGTIYAYDANGTLYAFPLQKLYLNDTPIPSYNRYRRWKLDMLSLYTAPETSPVIGADGFIAVNWGYAESTGYSAITLIRPDGVLEKYANIPGHAIGSLVVGADRVVYAATTSGYVGALDFFCYNTVCKTEKNLPVAFSTPPLLAYGNLYLGRVDGKVVKLTKDSLVEQASFQGSGEITAGPVTGPAGQVLVGTANGWLYSLTQDLTLRWQRNIGAPVNSIPAFSADGLYIVSNNRLMAFNPFSGNPSWSRILGSDVGDGSVAVGYGREIYLQTTGGKVFAYGEGWEFPFIQVFIKPVRVSPDLTHIRVELVRTAPPIEDGSGDEVSATQTTTLGTLLQRSVNGADWEDVAVLPEGTTAFTDTKVMDNTSYAYRAQVLSPDGNDSDFGYSLTAIQNPPALPGAPTLVDVSAEGAEILRLTWESPEGDLVDQYRIERSMSAGGPYTTTLPVSGGVTLTLDTGLEPGTTYFYRVVAINEMGESDASNVMNGTTREQSLPAPENVGATLDDDGRVVITWTMGPPGTTTEIEYGRGILLGTLPLATTRGTSSFSYFPGEPDIYFYRLKFVMGDEESDYSKTGNIIIEDKYRVYFPMILR
jgi:hypothetical protein